MRVRILARPALAPGPELAGVAVTRADDAAGAAAAIRQWVADTEVGIVLVDDGLYRALPRELLGRIDRRTLPVVAPFPVPRWDQPSRAEEYVVEILRRAIGYRVTPR